MATQKIQRWIDLLAALLKRRYPVPLEELAREVPGYEVGQSKPALRRTFERDKEELRAFGVPIETVTSGDEVMGYRLQPQYFYLPYLVLRSEGTKKAPSRVDRFGYRALQQLTFEPEELSAVVDAALRVRQLGDPLLAEHAESALRKLAVDLPVDSAMGPAPELVPPRAKASPDLLASLGKALEQRKQVSFNYHSMGGNGPTRRTVEPFGLFFLNQHWYLVARTPEDGAIKNYRLNRFTGVSVNSTRPGTPDYTIPATFSLRDHARSRQAWELGVGDAVEAVVHFRSRTGAAAAALRLGEEVAGHPENRRFRVRRSDAFARWLLSFAGDLVPASPRELVDEYNVLVRETLAHHSTAPLPPRSVARGKLSGPAAQP